MLVQNDVVNGAEMNMEKNKQTFIHSFKKKSNQSTHTRRFEVHYYGP